MGQVLGFCMKTFPDSIFTKRRDAKLNVNIGYILNHLLGRTPQSKQMGRGPFIRQIIEDMGPAPIHSTFQSNQMGIGPAQFHSAQAK